MAAAPPALVLGFGLSFPDLYDTDGLERVDAHFSRWLLAADPALHARWDAARRDRRERSRTRTRRSC